MASPEEQYDDAMFDFSQGGYASAVEKLSAILATHPDYFDAQLSLGMAYCRLGDFAKAIEEGHKAEKLRPHEQLVHTNLSLFYVKTGDKETAEHHGLQARISSWRGDMEPPKPASGEDAELRVARKQPQEIELPEMPWKKPTPDKPES